MGSPWTSEIEDGGFEYERNKPMGISPYTNSVMRALPAQLRPNPHSIDEAVMQAVENGWDTDSLAKAAYANDRNPNPAFVVTNIRNLATHPPTQATNRTGWTYGHIPCYDHPDCEICRCIPGETTHMTCTSVPDELRGTLRMLGKSIP